MNTPRMHAELIKAWADGAKIQFFLPGAGCEAWCDVETPVWGSGTKYRVKPEPHVHAELMAKHKAGAVIQFLNTHGVWYDVTDNIPMWTPSIKYRVKPTMLKYRRFIQHFQPSTPYIDTCVPGVGHRPDAIEKGHGFVRWIDKDWVEEPLEV